MADSKQREEEINDGFQKTYKKHSEIIPTLPKNKDWGELTELLLYNNFWVLNAFFRGFLLVQNHFTSKPQDIILATSPKCGTTWHRALIFTIINRKIHDFSSHPLLTNNPRDLCPFLEQYMEIFEPISPLDSLPSPRFLSTHIPFNLLPATVTSTASSCRIVYTCRNSKDVFISYWHFINKLRARIKQMPPVLLEDAFELFCKGISGFGPYWDHVLSYWKASLEAPQKVLFLKYEDMKREPLVQVKKIADFIGMPFSMEEQCQGVVEQIVKLCSFENLSNLEVNKTPTTSSNELVENHEFFRKGEIGDWKNYLTSEMADRMDQITKDKFYGFGLTFN